MIKKSFILIITVLIFLSLVSCSYKDTSANKELVIADQFGLAYAPVQIMKEKKFLEKRLKDYNIKWVKLGNASAIREAIVSEKLDVGFTGIPPFIIGYENDTPWKIITGLSQSPLGLVSSDKSIKTLKDIEKTFKIALPQPGSIQHILLSMAAKDKLNDSKHFDKQLVSMSHPNGMSALNSNSEIKLHFTSPPYLQKELEIDRNFLVISGKEAFGNEFTFIVGLGSKKLYENKDEYKAVKMAIFESIDFINKKPKETLNILSKYYEYDKDTLKSLIYDKDMKFSKEIKGLDKFIDFMYENDMINKSYESDKLRWE
ncbi:MAG: ABC transporter substrate-binding protein [Bacillota bacterium]